MDKNSILAVSLSVIVMVVWMQYFQPKPQPQQAASPAAASVVQESRAQQAGPRVSIAPISRDILLANARMPDQEFTISTSAWRAVFTSRGAAVKSWVVKDASGLEADLILPDNPAALATLPGAAYEVSRPDPMTIVFSHRSPEGWRLIKTYALKDGGFQKISIDVRAERPGAVLPTVAIDWGPGLGRDFSSKIGAPSIKKQLQENLTATRALGFSSQKPYKLRKLSMAEHSLGDYEWVGIDNRYFLAAILPGSGFDRVQVARGSKHAPPELSFSAVPRAGAETFAGDLTIYLGPKGYDRLKTFGVHLEKAVDFGFFDFLGKAALSVLLVFQRLTGNFGWAIILLTICMQILVMPLTLKSFEAAAAMKRLQPLMKQLQDKYKADPRRLNTEMMNLYKSHKVNPLGGCLPMLLQMPIFLALFTTLSNAIELRGAPWILWVHDLSMPDTLFHAGGIAVNILPLIMGGLMFLQQQMSSVSADPAQQKLMYFMPVIFTFMFWSFPSGLVLYWLTNSVLTIIEQYIVMKRQPAAAQTTVVTG